MGSVRALLASAKRWLLEQRRRRPWVGPVLLGEAVLIVVIVGVGLLVGPDRTPHPERVDTEVQTCDVGVKGTAQVLFTLHNGDRESHNYQVHMIVSAAGNKQLGANNVLVNHVGPDATVTTRALVVITGDASTASCVLGAEIFTGDLGHHERG